MFYELLTITPFAAVASCIALGVVTIIVCSNEVVPEASGFVVHDRRKVGPFGARLGLRDAAKRRRCDEGRRCPARC
jgi:hypothetical protein